MRRFLALGAALAILAGAAPAHAMAPVLIAISTAWSAYQQYDQVVSSAEKAALDVCMAWSETEGEKRGAARVMAAMHREAALAPFAAKAVADADRVMGQTATDVVPSACRDIPQGGFLETFVAAVNFLDPAPTPTAAAHIAKIKAAVAQKRAALGLPALPTSTIIPSPSNEAAKSYNPAFTIPQFYAVYR